MKLVLKQVARRSDQSKRNGRWKERVLGAVNFDLASCCAPLTDVEEPGVPNMGPDGQLG